MHGFLLAACRTSQRWGVCIKCLLCPQSHASVLPAAAARPCCDTLWHTGCCMRCCLCLAMMVKTPGCLHALAGFEVLLGTHMHSAWCEARDCPLSHPCYILPRHISKKVPGLAYPASTNMVPCFCTCFCLYILCLRQLTSCWYACLAHSLPLPTTNLCWTATATTAMFQVLEGGHGTLQVPTCVQKASSPLCNVDVTGLLMPGLHAGVPFRETHHMSGAAVKLAEDKGCQLSDLTTQDLQTINKLFEDDVQEVWDFDR